MTSKLSYGTALAICSRLCDFQMRDTGGPGKLGTNIAPLSRLSQVTTALLPLGIVQRACLPTSYPENRICRLSSCVGLIEMSGSSVVAHAYDRDECIKSSKSTWATKHHPMSKRLNKGTILRRKVHRSNYNLIIVLKTKQKTSPSPLLCFLRSHMVMLTWMSVAPDERSPSGSQPWSYMPLLSFNPNIWKGPEHTARCAYGKLWRQTSPQSPSLACFLSTSTMDAVSLGLSPLVSRVFFFIIHSSQR